MLIGVANGMIDEPQTNSSADEGADRRTAGALIAEANVELGGKLDKIGSRDENGDGDANADDADADAPD